MLSICGKNGAWGRLVTKAGAVALLLSALLAGCGSEKAENNGQRGSGNAGIEKNLEVGSDSVSGAASPVVGNVPEVAGVVRSVPETCAGNILRAWPKGELYSNAHSKLLWVDTACGERVAAIRSIVGKDTLEKRFVLRDSAAFAAGGKLPAELKGATVLRTPLKRVVALSSAQIGYMLRLGVEDRIVAVGAGKYIADSALYYRVKGNAPSGSNRNSPSSIEQVSPDGMNVDYEKLIALKPDLVMTFATGGSQDDYSRLEALGLPAMLTSEWQEEGVWEKAYWLKLYGALFGVDALADSILRESRTEMSFASTNKTPLCYGRTREAQEKNKARWDKWKTCKGRKVLAGMSYGGVWYAPGGNSYTAKLIKRAGGCYLWASDTTRELRLTIEDVIALADSADMWVNPGMFGTPEEILAAEPRAAHIKAFKNRKVFQNDGRKGPGGGNDFFESAVARPAELIQNLKSLILADSELLADTVGNDNESLPGLTPPVPLRSLKGLNKAQSEYLPYQWYHNIF